MNKKNGNGQNEERDWVEETSAQRKTLYSNVIIVESDDRMRITEMLGRRPMMASRTIEQEKWFVLDPWNGMMEVVYKPTEDNESYDYTYKRVEDIDVKTMGLAAALPKISDMLTEGNMVLIFTNLLKTDDTLNTAIMGWATSDEILNNDSTILLFVSNRYIFPTEVWPKLSIIAPPKSTIAERSNLLTDQETKLEEGSKQPIELLDDEELGSLVTLTAGLNLDQIEAAAIESIQLKYKLDIDLIAAIKRKRLGSDATVEIIQQPKFGFEVVGGYRSLKERIKDDIITPLKNVELAEHFGIRPPRGIILYGPPGTGKTLLVKSMAKELDVSVLLFHIENVLGKYVGESEKSMRRVFDIADAMAPCILFIDEFDKFSKRSTGDQAGSHVEREIFSMLLEKLGDEDRQWFFAAATNIIEAIDPAMRRTGRIDSVAPIPFPDEEARKQIFEIHTKIKRKVPMEKDVDSTEIAKKTYMWSGSDIEQLVIRTANYVMQDIIKKKEKPRSITMDDFRKILDTFMIPIDDNIKLQNQMKEHAKKFSNDKRLLDVFEQEAQKVIQTGRTGKAAAMMREKK